MVLRRYLELSDVRRPYQGSLGVQGRTVDAGDFYRHDAQMSWCDSSEKSLRRVADSHGSLSLVLDQLDRKSTVLLPLDFRLQRLLQKKFSK